MPLPSVRQTPGGTTLVQRGTLQVLTPYRSADVGLALVRGLADYLLGMAYHDQDGRHEAFAQIFDHWADPEEVAVYPSGYVALDGDVTYDASQFRPALLPIGDQSGADGMFLQKSCEAVATLKLEVWATDTEQRSMLVSDLEDAFNPTPEIYGFTLSLPHYHGLHARYSAERSTQPDSADDAQHGYRKATFKLSASCSLVRLVSAQRLIVSPRGPFARGTISATGVEDAPFDTEA
ncbi:MAG: hypothetical protein WC700_09015 [Gemmatimonadaceae bacterium]|jgi:hypothetical protein